MTVKTTEGMSIMSFVTAVADNAITGISIAGTGATLASDYQVGTVNFTALGAKASDFQDPKDDGNYVLGITTLKGGKYQLAASMEDSSGTEKAKISGTYTARTQAVKGTGTGVITLTSAEIGSYFVNDTLTGGGKVTKISADGTQVTTSGTVTTAELAASETAGLIGEVGTGTGIVTDAGSVLAY